MSTPGSVRSGEQSQYTPSSGGTASPSGTTKPKRVAFFRWKGVIPLGVFAALLLIGWMLFGERLIRETIEEAGTKALGAELDVADLDIQLFKSTVELRGIALADPFDVNRNLFEVRLLRVVLDPAPLIEKKLVVRQLSVADIATGTARKRPARPAPRDGFASRAATAVQQFVQQFKISPLSLLPIDSIKAIILDPTQLQTVQAALATGRGADSVKQALESEYAALNLKPALDSSTALLARLQQTNVRTLGVEGARRAVADVQQAAARVDSARQRVLQLNAHSQAGVALLQERVRAIDGARQADYAFARGLLRLPTVNAPDLGSAMFGTVSIDRFQKALYWTTLARQYAPPGLLPRETPGPKRMRRAGSTIHFVTPQSYPRFHLVAADVNATVTGGLAAGTYAMSVRDVTTDPAIVRRPTLFALHRVATSGDVQQLRIAGSLDQTTPRTREVVTMQAAGVSLPALPMPVLPYTLDPQRGTSELRFQMINDTISGHWLVRSNDVAWTLDAARKRNLNTIEAFVVRVLTGINQLDLTADISGTVKAPRLAVQSNLDRQVADGLRAAMGDAVANAEARVRAQVDRIADEKSAPVKARVAQLQTDAQKRIDDVQARLDEQKRKLDEKLKSLSSGLIGLPNIPGTQLPKLPTPKLPTPRLPLPKLPNA
jgi:uncharacterized protein (TIGR03545 family)